MHFRALRSTLKPSSAMQVFFLPPLSVVALAKPDCDSLPFIRQWGLSPFRRATPPAFGSPRSVEQKGLVLFEQVSAQCLSTDRACRWSCHDNSKFNLWLSHRSLWAINLKRHLQSLSCDSVFPVRKLEPEDGLSRFSSLRSLSSTRPVFIQWRWFGRS